MFAAAQQAVAHGLSMTLPALHLSKLRSLAMASPAPEPAASEFAQLLDRARAGSREALGEVLTICRRYLLRVATRQIDSDLKIKGSPSDLVQETFLDAQQDFAHFTGGSEQEFLAWLG